MKLWFFLNNGLLPNILRVQTVFTGTLTEHWLLSVDGGTKLLLQRGFLMFIFFKCVVNSHMCPRCSVSVNMSKIEFNKKVSIYQVACFSTVAPTTPFTVCPYCKVDFYPLWSSTYFSQLQTVSWWCWWRDPGVPSRGGGGLLYRRPRQFCRRERDAI